MDYIPYLNIILQSIQNSSILDDLTKAKAESEIIHMLESDEYFTPRKCINTYNMNVASVRSIIHNLFVWRLTLDGHEFWKKISDYIEDQVREIARVQEPQSIEYLTELIQLVIDSINSNYRIADHNKLMAIDDLNKMLSDPNYGLVVKFGDRVTPYTKSFPAKIIISCLFIYSHSELGGIFWQRVSGNL